MPRAGVSIHIKRTGSWGGTQKTLLRVAKLMPEIIDRVIEEEAKFAARRIALGIEKQAPAGKSFSPPSPATILARRARGIRSNKTLMASKEMLRAIKMHKLRRGYWFAGILKGTKNKRGRDLAEMASIHENGAGPFIVRMTPKMRKFLFGVIFKNQPRRSGRGGGRAGYITIRTPARPFVRPVAEKIGRPSTAQQRIRRRYQRVLSRASRAFK